MSHLHSVKYIILIYIKMAGYIITLWCIKVKKKNNILLSLPTHEFGNGKTVKTVHVIDVTY